MIRKIVVMAVFMTVLIYGTVARAEQTLRVFNVSDVQASLSEDAQCKLDAEVVPLGGSNHAAFKYRWHDAAGNYPLIRFTTADQDASLCGWVCIGPQVVRPKSIRLILLQDDNALEEVSETTISQSGSAVRFRLPLQEKKGSNRFLVYMHVPDAASTEAARGLVIFADLGLEKESFPVPASHGESTPPSGLSEMMLRQFTAADFVPEIIGLTSPGTLALAAGKSAILTFRHPCPKFSLGNPKTAECASWGTNQVIVTGVSPGTTSLIASVAGEGTLDPVDIVVSAPPASLAVGGGPVVAAPPWFNPRFFWIAVAILPLVSLIALLEPLIRRGKGRMMVMGWIWVWFAIAQICFAWGMAALGHGEPLKQVGPMLLSSMVVWTAMLFASRRMSRRYRDVELKRMQLMDIV